MDNPWEHYDRESWFEQYYRNSHHVPTSFSDQPASSPSLDSPTVPGNDDSYSNQYVPKFNELDIPISDEPAVVAETRIEDTTPVNSSDARCDDPSCPCHDIIDFDSNGPTSQAVDSSLTERFSPVDASTFEMFDVYEPYSFEIGPSTETPPDTAIPARLNGTIEPICEECDEPMAEDSFEQPEVSTIESNTIAEQSAEQTTAGSVEHSEESSVETDTAFDDSDPTSTDDRTSGADEGPQDATTDLEFDATDPPVRFHMFYPGFDWDSYLRVDAGQRTGQPVTDTDFLVQDSIACDSDELTIQAD